MTIGILIITHNQIGQALLDTATNMLGTCPLECATLSLSPDADPDASLRQARDRVGELDKGDGVLVLTDMYGSTPSNIAAGLGKSADIIVVAGINLPMLIRVMNYPQLDLSQLAAKAESGGNDGIFSFSPTSGL
ncbi:MAG TPA: PTS fructose transporter subunit IIA [Gammaproteobacteria bacterium]|nr:PTS fructose transporter subunit IIA [Gammaproteobacteria bacterium]